MLHIHVADVHMSLMLIFLDRESPLLLKDFENFALLVCSFILASYNFFICVVCDTKLFNVTKAM